MLKRKKSKIDNLEKLHHFLDNLNDSDIKKSIPKEDKKSDKIETKIVIHKKEDRIAEPKQFKDSLSKTSDFYEVEKGDDLKPEFLEVKPKQIAKEFEIVKKEEKIIEDTPKFEKIEKRIETPTKKIIRKPSLHKDKKDKMMIFREADIDEIFNKTSGKMLSSDKIQMYKLITIIEMWAFTLVLGVVAFSGLFLLRDWLFLNFGVYGDNIIPTPAGTQNIHIWFGLAFVIIGLFHIIIHVFSKKKDILPKKTLRDFKAFLHSGMYIIGLARRESYGNSGRYYERQRIFYLAVVYILGLTTITGLLYYGDFFSSDLSLVHVIPGGLGLLVLLFHFLITIRKHDTTALKCAFITGKLPRWYVRKTHPIWYKKMRAERESLLNEYTHSINPASNKTLIEQENELNNALFKFSQLTNRFTDPEELKEFIEELKTFIPSDKLGRIIELSEGLEDGFDGKIKQESIDVTK